jgi:hypothetical protein
MRSVDEGEWVSWSIDGRAGAKLCLGPVFLGEISYPHDFGLGARWRASLNHEHLGYFRDEDEAKQRIEAQIVKRLRLMEPAWAKFQARAQRTAGVLQFPRAAAAIPGALPHLHPTATRTERRMAGSPMRDASESGDLLTLPQAAKI